MMNIEIVKADSKYLDADFNPKAKAFYMQLSYIEVGILPNLYKKGVAEYGIFVDEGTGIIISIRYNTLPKKSFTL